VTSAICGEPTKELPVNEYSFISVAAKRRREGLYLDDDYRDIIRDRAAVGWKFVQAISFEQHIEPHIDLVFTRKGEIS
jgi:hypothetical protein